MRKGSDLVGKPVIAFDTGQQFERIEDLIFDQESNQLLGFLVDEGGWFSTANVIPLQSVQTIGPDAVIVPSKTAEVSAERVPEIKRILDRNNVLRGTKIMTTDGRDLGIMTDLYFDEKTGAVEGYEVSGGIFADAYSGRAFVPAPQTLKIGDDVAFVPPETATLMEEQVGGIKAAVQTTGDKLEHATVSAGDRLQEYTQQATASFTNAAVDPSQQKAFVIGKIADRNVETPNGMLLVAQGQQVTPLAADEAQRQGVLDHLYRATGGSVTAALGNRLGNAVAGSDVEAARGRRVQHAIRTDGGVVIAAPSQIVTEQVINRARTYHKEAELLAAVGLSPSTATEDRATPVANDRLQASNVNESGSATGLWGKVKAKLSNLQDQEAQLLEERRIKRALGRPVDRVILDPQDNVILNVGEIITHQAVEQARQADVLDILLSSVYDKEPEISTEEMRAPEPGEAALQQRERNTQQQG